MQDKFIANQVKIRLQEIRKEQAPLREAVEKYNKLEREADKLVRDLKKNCKHENAFVHTEEVDEHEGRTYGNIICHDCGHRWQERIYLGRYPYPKWTGGPKW